MRPEEAPDAPWVAALAGGSLARAETGLGWARGEVGLYAHLEREHRREGRRSYVEIDAPLELYAIARLTRPRHVVEVGVSSGVSSAYLLGALERNRRGTLHSIDRPSRPRRGGPRATGASWSLPEGRHSGWAVPRALRRRWDLRLGDKADLGPVLAQELPVVDLVVYDVPHEEADVRRELRWFDPLLSARASVIVDHGPGGGMCAALRAWARGRGATPVRRTGLGLYGARSSGNRRARERGGLSGRGSP